MSQTRIRAEIIIDHTTTPPTRQQVLVLPCWYTGLDTGVVTLTVSNGDAGTRYITVDTATAQRLDLIDKRREDLRFLYKELQEPRGPIWFAIIGIMDPDGVILACYDMINTLVESTDS